MLNPGHPDVDMTLLDVWEYSKIPNNESTSGLFELVLELNSAYANYGIIFE